VNAYRFTSNQSTWDLNLIDPYDPNVPPPPLPMPLINELLVVPAVDPIVYDGSQYPTFATLLPGNINNVSFTNMQPGNLYTFIIIQDAVGGWNFVWPPNAYNAARIDHRPNATTIQTFVADEQGDLYAIAPGTYSL
jgi:hypothetical protein